MYVFFPIDCTPPFEVYVYADSLADAAAPTITTGTRGKCCVF